MPVDSTSSLDQHATNTHTASFQDKSLSDFITSAQEAKALAELKDEMKTYMFQKVAVNSKRPQRLLFSHKSKSY